MIWHFQAIDIDPESETFGMVLFEFDYQKAHPEVSSLWGMGEYIAASQGNGELEYNKRVNRKFLIPYGLNTLLDSNTGHIAHTWIQIPTRNFCIGQESESESESVPYPSPAM